MNGEASTVEDFNFDLFPVKAYNMRLGQTLCEHCQLGLPLEEMIFRQNGGDYGYYHPDCLPE